MYSARCTLSHWQKEQIVQGILERGYLKFVPLHALELNKIAHTTKPP